MQFGISTASYFGRLDTLEAAAAISRLGIDCCEVFMQTYSEYTPSFGAALRARIGDFPVTSIHALSLHYEANLQSRSPKQNSESWDMWAGALAAGQAMGASRYVYHGYPNIHGESGRPSDKSYAEMARRGAAFCAERGIRLCWENVSWCYFDRYEMADLLAPHTGFTLDIKQARRAGLDPVALAARMGTRLLNVHICDMDADGRTCLPGAGVLALDALGNTLRDIGYDGPIILEVYPSNYSEEGQLREACDVLRRIMG